ncbi:MAG: hypothetical protein C0598_09090 [Marinilabiliales bacterium]|nr:MAG: hypothetical protein C0598_09090 [Marinilabiliales bacterium]
MKKEFIKSTKAERVISVLKDGEMLAKRNQNGFDIVLFAIDDFFAEIRYHQNSTIIVSVDTITQESVLENYSQLVEIPKIKSLGSNVH